jgi:hypothetical protein
MAWKYYLKKAREAALNLLPQPADLKIPSPAVTPEPEPALVRLDGMVVHPDVYVAKMREGDGPKRLAAKAADDFVGRAIDLG